MNFSRDDIPGMKVTVMGLGLHGGGTASALFFASHGAEVTVTDLRNEEQLRPSIEQLKDFSIRYVLGRHETDDFNGADMVIKNPGVPGSSPFLEKASIVETDISIFLRLADAPLLAVTGSKGKSTTVSALYYILKAEYPDTGLGGNITVSPLTFIDTFFRRDAADTPVVLELSSWQLADLKDKNILHPEICCITNILHDHQNRYNTFDDYIDDKRVIYLGQNVSDVSLFNYDDDYGKSFAEETNGRVNFFSVNELPSGVDGGWVKTSGEGICRTAGETCTILPEQVTLPGMHNRINLLCAGLMARSFGVSEEIIRTRTEKFPGIPHRLEYIGEVKGIRFYNDSAATIPDAVLHAVQTFPDNCVLITGGTDKNLDFSPYEQIVEIPKAILLLAGSATEKIIPILKKKGVEYFGPYSDLESVVRKTLEITPERGVALFSPGCASFELFKNEFDRGNKFKLAVENCI